MPSLKHSPVPASNKELAALQTRRKAANQLFAKQCLAVLLLLVLGTAVTSCEAAPATAASMATALSSNSKALSPEAVTELSVTASTHANIYPQGVPYTVKPLNCTSDTQCEKKAARRILSLEKEIVAAKLSISKHGAAILRMNDKLQAMQKEIASLHEMPIIESLKDADAGTK